jgi:cell division transport system permease protein
MTGASLKYLIKEGFRNTWTNRMMSIASICVLMSCLVLIGSASMMFLNIDSLLGKIEEENVIMVYISDGTTDEEIANMENEIKACGNIKQVEFVSKEDAWAEQLSTMEDAQAEFFTQISSDIPLPDAYKVTVENLDQFNDTVSKLKQLQHIDTIRENQNLAKKLVAIRQGITVIAFVIIAVLFVISLFIISNTIKLTVYSRRLEISIMKSVGATNSFVRLPFVVEGMILGIVSGIISLGLVWGLYELAVNEFADLLSTFNGLDFLKFQNYALPMLGIFVAIGVVTGVGGSLITMSKYLNKEGSEISGI